MRHSDAPPKVIDEISARRENFDFFISSETSKYRIRSQREGLLKNVYLTRRYPIIEMRHSDAPPKAIDEISARREIEFFTSHQVA